MAASIFCNKWLVLTLAFFSPMIINIGGEVSPSFLFITLTLPFWKKHVKWQREAEVKSLLVLLGVLTCLQFLWFPFSNVENIIQFKGVMITISGIIYFLFYYFVYTNNIDLVLWHLIGTFLASFVFINNLANIAGGDFGFWKFQVMPRIVAFTSIAYVYFCDNNIMRKYGAIIYVLVGILGIVTGARSCGLTPLVAGLCCLIIQTRTNLDLRSVKKYILLCVSLVYVIYAFVYIPSVIDGKINAGNSDQIKRLENPYNPINLLLIGRTDSFVPFLAFSDNILGWGYMVNDPNNKYNKLLLDMKREAGEIINQNSKSKNFIPAHSVIGYYSCSYGIGALLIFLSVIYSISKNVYHSLIYNDKYFVIRVVMYWGLVWNLFFSPMPHFKTLPISIATIIAMSHYAKKRMERRMYTD